MCKSIGLALVFLLAVTTTAFAILESRNCLSSLSPKAIATPALNSGLDFQRQHQVMIAVTLFNCYVGSTKPEWAFNCDGFSASGWHTDWIECVRHLSASNDHLYGTFDTFLKHLDDYSWYLKHDTQQQLAVESMIEISSSLNNALLALNTTQSLHNSIGMFVHQFGQYDLPEFTHTLSLLDPLLTIVEEVNSFALNRHEMLDSLRFHSKNFQQVEMILTATVAIIAWTLSVTALHLPFFISTIAVFSSLLAHSMGFINGLRSVQIITIALLLIWVVFGRVYDHYNDFQDARISRLRIIRQRMNSIELLRTSELS